MRHKYATRGIVFTRIPFGEAHARLAIVTEEFGIVQARAIGIRRSQSKLAHALVTLCESDLVLVAGAEGWRIAGAVLVKNWYMPLEHSGTRERAGRVASLLLRLSPGEEPERASYQLFASYLAALVASNDVLGEAAELVAVEAALTAFGVGERSSGSPDFSPGVLANALSDRALLVARINRGITASGL